MAWVNMTTPREEGERKREEGYMRWPVPRLFSPSSFFRLPSSFGSSRYKQPRHIHHQESGRKSGHLIAEGRPFPEHELQQLVDHLEDGAGADGEKQRGQDR